MKVVSIVTLTVASLFSLPASAQERESLFPGDMDASFSWNLGLSSASAQGQFGTALSAGVGMVFNTSYYAGLAICANLSNDNLNHGYAGVQAAYISDQSRLLHWRAHVLIASGGMKEYLRPKHGLMDDFGNVFGAGYVLIEPGIAVEMNISGDVSLTTGLSYRLATGLDGNDPNVVNRKPSNSDMSGVVLTLGLVFY